MRPLFPSILATALSLPLAAQSVGEFTFEVESLSGPTLKHTDFEKSLLLVDFWGTWCGPCREAVPELQRLYAKYKQHGFEIVALAYEGAAKDPEEKVRKFAAQNGVTYHLGIGTPAIKRQVKGFTGYPTLLVFKRGLQFDHAETGFGPASGAKLEDWIRAELGLEPLDRTEAPQPVNNGNPANAAGPQPAANDEPLKLPKGVVFQPGDGDTGFAFEVEDVDGKTLKFSDLRGKPVVLAMTSTWDSTAVVAAKTLKALHAKYEDRVHVLAASLELRASNERKVKKIKAFMKEHELGYRAFPAGIGFQKKIYQFSGMPMFLVFDAEGVLVLRKAGADGDAGAGKELDATREEVETQLEGLVGN